MNADEPRPAPVDSPRPAAANQPGRATLGSSWRLDLLARYPWLGYVLPIVIFLVVTSLEPTPPEPANQIIQTDESPSWFDLDIPYGAYPILYTAKLALTI